MNPGTRNPEPGTPEPRNPEPLQPGTCCPVRILSQSWMSSARRRTMDPSVPPVPPASTRAAKPAAKQARAPKWRRGWKFYVLVGVGVPLLCLMALAVFFYISFSRQIDARLRGETERADPRIFARAYEL